MAAKAISIRDLAEKTGLSYCYVSNLITGCKHSEKGLSAIINALGMNQILRDIEPTGGASDADQHVQEGK
jgi:hypothetical protein